MERSFPGGGMSLSLLSAVLLVLAQPPFHVPFLSFLALVPLAVALGRIREPGDRGVSRPLPERGGGTSSAESGIRLPSPISSRLEAARLGLVFGVTHWALLLLWIPVLVAPRFPWAWTGFGALLGILGGLSALLGWGVHRLHARARLPLGLAFPLAWVGVEWLKGHFPFGLAWPWMGLGVTLTRWPTLLGMAEWVGEAGVSFWLAAVNGLVASALLASRSPSVLPGVRRAALAFAAALLPALTGVIRARTLSLEPGPVVAVVGTLVPRELRDDPASSTRTALEQVETALARVPPGAADLVFLPEGTVTLPPGGPGGRAAREELLALTRALGVPLLVGTLENAPPGADLGGAVAEGEDRRFTNSAVLVTRAGGGAYRYDKVRLVPGMEWGDLRAGSSPRPGRVGRVGFGPLICYESLFAGLARGMRLDGADLLVNLTSDIWFGDPEGVVGRLFLEQHPAHLILRAVENRMPAARAANGGFSLLLDPLGRRVGEELPPGEGAVLAPLPLHPGIPLFSRTGDLVGPGAILLSLILMAWTGVEGRRRRAA